MYSFNFYIKLKKMLHQILFINKHKTNYKLGLKKDETLFLVFFSNNIISFDIF